MSAVASSAFNNVFKQVQARHKQQADAGWRTAHALGRFRAVASAAVAPATPQRPADAPVDELAQAHRAYTHVAPPRPADITLAQLIATLDETPSIDDLRALRRAFAATRHPDRVSQAERQRATEEMQTANDLIDRAIEERWAGAGVA